MAYFKIWYSRKIIKKRYILLKELICSIIKTFVQKKRVIEKVPGLDEQIAELQKKINYRFQDKELLVASLTHDSYTYEGYQNKNENTIENNLLYERMEFLGDAVLGLVVAEFLFSLYPSEDEGFLSKLKSNIVSEKYLAVKGSKFQLGDHIIMSYKEAKNGGRERKSIIADTMEALICAIYLDSGISKAREFITTYIIDDFEKQVQMSELINYKSILQEYCQALHQTTPEYKHIGDKGPDHQKIFIMEVYINGELQGKGEGVTKKDAHQAAAKNACHKLKLK